MKSIKKYITTLILLIISCNLIAQTSNINNSPNKYSISIEAELKDSLKTKVHTTLGFDIFESYSFFGIRLNSENIKVPDLHKEKFKETISLPSADSFLKIRLKIGKRSTFNYNDIFLVESGDSIQCEIHEDSIYFSGRGSEKMNLQFKLWKITNKYQVKSNSNDPDNYFLNKKKFIEKELIEQLAILEKSKPTINDKMYNYLYNQCVGLSKFRMTYFVLVAQSKPKIIADKAIEFFNANLKPSNKKLNDEINICSYYTDFLYLKERLDFNFTKKNDSNINIANFLKKIRESYTGKIRDKVILTAFSDLPSFNKENNIFPLLDSILKKTDNKQYKNLLIKFKKSLSPGMPAFPFALPDSSGKIIKMSDLKGKVIVMDFWFTGCIPCQKLAKNMIPIIEHFKNKDVIFVNVNIDIKMDLWKKSLLSGKYTHPQSINLFTNGLGAHHSIMNHYNINSCPQLIIVDKDGRILSTNPPIPLDKKGAKELSDIVELNL